MNIVALLARRGVNGLALLLAVLYHLFLSMVTLASIFLALYSRLARASMLDVLGRTTYALPGRRGSRSSRSSTSMRSATHSDRW